MSTLLERLTDAQNAHDVELFASCFAPDHLGPAVRRWDLQPGPHGTFGTPRGPGPTPACGHDLVPAH